MAESIRMVKRSLGSPDGIRVRWYEQDAVLELGVDIPVELARAFVSERWAVEVKAVPKPENKAMKSVENK